MLRTAVSPTFAQIGQLAAIAATSTGPNYILGREIESERTIVIRKIVLAGFSIPISGRTRPRRSGR